MSANAQLAGLISVTFKLVTKKVVGVPWDREFEFNYFRAILVVEGEEIDPRTIWSKSETEAIKASARWLAEQLEEDVKLERDYKGRPRPAYGRASQENYRGYCKLDDDPNYIKLWESVR